MYLPAIAPLSSSTMASSLRVCTEIIMELRSVLRNKTHFFLSKYRLKK
jgi:hypothetical protein